jgi:hypothetical protein
MLWYCKVWKESSWDEAHKDTSRLYIVDSFLFRGETQLELSGQLITTHWATWGTCHDTLIRVRRPFMAFLHASTGPHWEAYR